MSEQQAASQNQPAPASEPAAQEPLSRSGRDRARGLLGGLLGSSVGRNLGLVVALVILCLVGVTTAGQQFASADSALTILRLAAVIGVVSVGTAASGRPATRRRLG